MRQFSAPVYLLEIYLLVAPPLIVLAGFIYALYCVVPMLYFQYGTNSVSSRR